MTRPNIWEHKTYSKPPTRCENLERFRYVQIAGQLMSWWIVWRVRFSRQWIKIRLMWLRCRVLFSPYHTLFDAATFILHGTRRFLSQMAFSVAWKLEIYPRSGDFTWFCYVNHGWRMGFSWIFQVFPIIFRHMEMEPLEPWPNSLSSRMGIEKPESRRKSTTCSLGEVTTDPGGSKWELRNL